MYTYFVSIQYIESNVSLYVRIATLQLCQTHSISRIVLYGYPIVNVFAYIHTCDLHICTYVAMHNFITMQLYCKIMYEHANVVDSTMCKGNV